MNFVLKLACLLNKNSSNTVNSIGRRLLCVILHTPMLYDSLKLVELEVLYTIRCTN